MYKYCLATGALVMYSLAVTAAYGADQLSDADKEFMTKAAQINLFEIRSGELAQKKTTNGDVRQLAARLTTDHSMNNAELKKLAGKYEFKLPDKPNEKLQEQMQRLEKLTGPEFDRTYVQLMIDDHKDAIALFEKQVGHSKGDVKQYAERTLPVLREHLKLAEQTQKKLG
jgi:putative membrane protein